MLSRVLTTTEDDPNAYGCFARVKNGGGKLVGQLMGNCAKVTASGNMSATAKATLCIPKVQTRKVFASYTQGAFANDGTFTLANVADAKDDGANICGSVPVNTMLCPALVATNSASATADVGAASCPAMTKIKAAVQQAAAFAAPMSNQVRG